MQIKKLVVCQGLEVIRNIEFNSGLNIITNAGDSGNQIGKSTTLRILNFCLGSDGESIWKDPDSKVNNEEIYNKVVFGNVKFHLTVNVNGTNYNIVRGFELKRTKLYRISTINDVPYNSQDRFKNEISKIFGHTSKIPSFSTLKNRFTRLNKSTANLLLNYNNTYTSKDQYKLIYSHLFGFDGHAELEAEYENKQEINQLKQRRSALLNGQSITDYQDRLSSIDKELDRLFQIESSYDIVGVQSDVIEKIRYLRGRISKVSMEVSQLEIRLDYNNKTIRDYESKISNIDIDIVRSIYEEATSLLPKVYKSFHETMDFHNSLFQKKASFIREQNVSLEIKLKNFNERLNELLLQEKELVKRISNESHLAGFILIEKEIQHQKELRGKFSYVVDEVLSIDKSASELYQKNASLQSTISKKLSEFEAKVGQFNDSCSEITHRLFGTFSIYFGSTIDPENAINFSLVNADKTMGDGSPRAAAMAIDMAFVEYVKKSKAKLPMFTLQDYLEATDLYKLTELFKIANEKEIQTIVSVLNDKLTLLDEGFLDKYTVLKLSPTDKFFKV